MSLIKCKKCGSEVNSDSKSCSICGSALQVGASRFTNFVLISATSLLFLVLFAPKLYSVFLWVIGSPNPSSEVKPPEIIRSSTVSKPLKLKDLALGVKLASLSSLNVKPVKLGTTDTFTFEYDFFGSTNSVIGSVNSAGVVYEYHINIRSGLNELKSAIESKYSEQEGKPIGFNCNLKIFTSPDGSAKISTETCKLSRGSEVLQTERQTVEDPRKPAYILPVSDLSSVQLVDTRIASEVEAAAKNAAAIKEKAAQDKRKKDI